MAAPNATDKAKVAAFVQWLYKRSSLPSWGEFARQCEVLPSQMSDWSRGVNAPGAINLLRMLEVADAVRSDEETPKVASYTIVELGVLMVQARRAQDRMVTEVKRLATAVQANEESLRILLEARNSPQQRRRSNG